MFANRNHSTQRAKEGKFAVGPHTTSGARPVLGDLQKKSLNPNFNPYGDQTTTKLLSNQKLNFSKKDTYDFNILKIQSMMRLKIQDQFQGTAMHRNASSPSIMVAGGGGGGGGGSEARRRSPNDSALSGHLPKFNSLKMINIQQNVSRDNARTEL